MPQTKQYVLRAIQPSCKLPSERRKVMNKMRTEKQTEYEIQIDNFAEGLRDLNVDLVDRNLEEFLETPSEEWPRVELKLIDLARMLSCLAANLLEDMGSLAINGWGKR